MPRSGTAESYGSSIFSFLRSILFSIVVVLAYIPTNSIGGYPFLHTFSCTIFNDGHSDQCEVVLHCSSDLHFSSNEWCWAFFSWLCWPSVCLLWRNAYLGLLPIFHPPFLRMNLLLAVMGGAFPWAKAHSPGLLLGPCCHMSHTLTQRTNPCWATAQATQCYTLTASTLLLGPCPLPGHSLTQRAHSAPSMCDT